MKTAIIIGGDVRTFLDCFPSLESNILNYNECDVYLHLYDEPITKKAIDLLKPKKYVVENKSDVIHNIHPTCYVNKPQETDPIGVFFQWRTVQKAFNLIENEHYDVIIKTRYDVKYTNPMKIKDHDPTFLNVPQGGDWRGGLFDMMAWGSKTVMSRYCSLYERINDYVISGVPCHSELLNLHNNKTNIIKRHDYSVLLRRVFDRGFVEDRVFTLR